MVPAPLGQNFLAGEGWRGRIFSLLGARAGDIWLEIGAGHGEMTELLAGRAARVIALELDAQLAAGLRKRAANWPNVEVVEADVLASDLARIAGAPKFRIYGSIPYYITSPILHRIYDTSAHIESAHLIMQLEVAKRLAAKPGHREYGYLSVATQFYARPEILLKIPPGAFRPQPKVDSALVALRFPGPGADLNLDDSAFLEFVQGCFAQKRKTLVNNLRGKLPSAKPARGSKRSKSNSNSLSDILRNAGISERARAEELSLDQFAALHRILNSKTNTTQTK
ncbi:MAG TPA: 16S rRNA (adenine(1518)-N(6)/adenine(1519)-N(6))-dimethyltransferase RsmA [Candidatus Acidoferrales bacterium]|nr:16S rRNA (adenine(1518)-N(6)/adenine(1519)-N(6))-dimethyltransferase RsmA [Candidatus Acidoferrales bacterium]